MYLIKETLCSGLKFEHEKILLSNTKITYSLDESTYLFICYYAIRLPYYYKRGGWKTITHYSYYDPYFRSSRVFHYIFIP